MKVPLIHLNELFIIPLMIPNCLHKIIGTMDLDPEITVFFSVHTHTYVMKGTGLVWAQGSVCLYRRVFGASTF